MASGDQWPERWWRSIGRPAQSVPRRSRFRRRPCFATPKSTISLPPSCRANSDRTVFSTAYLSRFKGAKSRRGMVFRQNGHRGVASARRVPGLACFILQSGNWRVCGVVRSQALAGKLSLGNGAADTDGTNCLKPWPWRHQKPHQDDKGRGRISIAQRTRYRRHWLLQVL